MEVQIKHQPSFSCLFVDLPSGERITAEADAMASMSGNVTFDTKNLGGFLQSMFRMVAGGESLFVNEFYLEQGSKGELVLTQNVPGDIVEMELKGNSIYLQPGAFLACTGDITIKPRWAGFKSWMAGEGFFRTEASGNGKIWFGAFGGVLKKEVKGEYIVDTAHLVAYEPQLNLKIQTATGGLLSSYFSGEGFVTRMEGSGTIYLQTRILKGLADWINPRLM